MTMLPSDSAGVERRPDTKLFDRVLRLMSVLTMVMTVPQAITVWTSHSADAVSLVSWMAYLLSACLWLVYGLRKRDKTIYLACVGWILLDATIVAGVIARG